MREIVIKPPVKRPLIIAQVDTRNTALKPSHQKVEENIFACTNRRTF